MPRIMYGNGDGLVGKEFNIKDRIVKSKPGIIGIVEIKLSEDVNSHMVIPERYTITRRSREGRGGGRSSPTGEGNHKFLRSNGKQWVF